jgi:hypothetical protein
VTPILTQDTLDWFPVSAPPSPDADLLVDCLVDGVPKWALSHGSQPWPLGAWRWAVLRR